MNKVRNKIKIIILKVKRLARQKELWVLLLVVMAVAVFFFLFGTGAGKEGKKTAELPIKPGTVGEASASAISGPLVGDTFTLAQQEGGDIVIAGQIKTGNIRQFAIARYDKSGNPDRSFGGSGKMATDFGGFDNTAYAAVVQADGKVVVGGGSSNGRDYDFALTRFNANGTLDPAFGNGGKVLADFGGGDDVIVALAAAGGGKILAFGESWQKSVSYYALTRYNSDGTLDTSFGEGGKAADPLEGSGTSMALPGDGKIVVGGITHISKSGKESYAVGVARYNSNGTRDDSFGNNGEVVTAAGGMSGAVGVVVQSDGKIVVAGTTGAGTVKRENLALMRLNRDGSIDKTFGEGGVASVDFGNSSDTAYVVGLQADGKFVVAGTIEGVSGDLAMARITGGGQLDNTFGNGGRVTRFGGSKIIPLGLKIQKDGKIIMVGVDGQNAFVMARYAGDGSAEASFKPE